MISTPILFKGLIAAIIVGFVTSSIRSWIDRVFLVIMLVTIVGLPINEAIQVNLLVLAFSALFHILRNGKQLKNAVPAGSSEWLIIVISAIIGGITGRLINSITGPAVLMVTLGVYAILVGLRILFIKPISEKEIKAHPALLSPVSLAGGFLSGLISAGGKPFIVPAYNNAMGHHPKRAYALASLGVVAGAFASILTQAALPSSFSADQLLLALYEFILVTLIALLVNKFWTEKLAKIVNLTIAPILMLVGIKFLLSLLK